MSYLVAKPRRQVFSPRGSYGFILFAQVCQNILDHYHKFVCFFSSPEPKAYRLAYSMARHPSFSHDISLKPWSRFLPNFTWHLYGNLTYNEKNENWHLGTSLHTFWQKFYRNGCWVVLHQTCHFSPNHSVLLVAIPTKRLNLWKKINKKSTQMG